MKIFSATFGKNSFFIEADSQSDFWVLLSKRLGWGKFSIVEGRESTSGLFELIELLPAGSKPPESVIVASNVLLSRQEALSTFLKDLSSFQHPELRSSPPLEELREYQREVARSVRSK